MGRRVREATTRTAPHHHPPHLSRRHVLFDHDLPPFWQTVTLFNPVVYLVSGFRWSFYEIADVSPAVSLAMIGLFLAICLAVVWWIFKTGYRLKS